jgi:hypothetical protein
MIISKVEQAKRIASYGFRILKVRPDSKEPVVGVNWTEEATDSLELIDWWFSEDPELNYGVMGGDKGIIIDLDKKPDKDIDGLDTLIEVEIEENDPLHDKSFRVTSPSGGTHIYLRTHKPVSNSHNFGNNSGIDIRGAHGYVVGPGCTFNGVSYVAENDISEIKFAPEWLVSKYLKIPGQKDERSDDPIIELDRPENIELAKDLLRESLPAIEGQNGNDHTYKIALEIRDAGVSDYKCLQLLHESEWNTRCEPPWDLTELEPLVEHVYKYGKNRPGVGADFLSYYEAVVGIETVEQENVGVGDGDIEDYLFTPDKFKSRGKRRDYIIPEWLISHGFTAINAKRSMGKSTIMLDLACSIACGMEWQGSSVKSGYVPIYLCGEDDEGLELNMIAWEKENGEVPDENMIIADHVPNLMSAEDIDKWANAIKKKLKKRKAVVIMDTWQRASSYGGQNSDEDMQKCVAHAEALARFLDGPAVVAFHPPKYSERTIHGSAVIENSSTAIWQLEECVEGRLLTVTRIKGPGEGNFKKFKFIQVELDEKDSFGNNRKGLVPKKIGGTEDKNIGEKETRRAAWAKAVYGLQCYMEEQPDYQNKPLTFNFASSQIDKLSKEAPFRDAYLKDLTDSGVHAFGQTSIKKEWKDVFPINVQGVVIESVGKVLSIKEGGNRMFRISNAQTA